MSAAQQLYDAGTAHTSETLTRHGPQCLSVSGYCGRPCVLVMISWNPLDTRVQQRQQLEKKV